MKVKTLTEHFDVVANVHEQDTFERIYSGILCGSEAFANFCTIGLVSFVLSSKKGHKDSHSE